MKLKLRKEEKKQFKPIDLVITFESRDEIKALLTLMVNTEPQTWSGTSKLAVILDQYLMEN